MHQCFFSPATCCQPSASLNLQIKEIKINKTSLLRVLVDVEVLSAALEMSQAVLQQDPCQLASQLMGRLGQMVIEDHPVTKGII